MLVMPVMPFQISAIGVIQVLRDDVSTVHICHYFGCARGVLCILTLYFYFFKAQSRHGKTCQSCKTCRKCEQNSKLLNYVNLHLARTREKGVTDEGVASAARRSDRLNVGYMKADAVDRLRWPIELYCRDDYQLIL